MESRLAFQQAHIRAKKLPAHKCFPNYFLNIVELASQDIYVAAVEYFGKGQFGKAGETFDTWLSLNSGGNKVRNHYIDIKLFSVICRAVQRELDGTASLADWQSVEWASKPPQLWRTTWPLIERVLVFKSIASLQPRNDKRVRKAASALAKDWLFLAFDTQLEGSDRVASLARGVDIPSFLIECLDTDRSRDDWKNVLLQTARNGFLLVLDYQVRRGLRRNPESARSPLWAVSLVAWEQASIKQITEALRAHLEMCDKTKVERIDAAIGLLPLLHEHISNDDLESALETTRAILTRTRLMPFVVRAEDSVHNPLLGRGTPRTTLTKLCAIRPTSFVVESTETLKPGRFYFMRSRWYFRTGELYKPSQERMWESPLPGHLCTFADNVFGSALASGRRFQDWLFQFGQADRFLALRLRGMMSFYGDNDVRAMWRDFYLNRFPPEAKGGSVCFAGLGHTGKSGHHCLYDLRQAILSVPKNLQAVEMTTAFRTLDDIDASRERPQTVVFLDDFVGEGTQASRHLGNALSKYHWLGSCRIMFCSLVGFRSGNVRIAHEVGLNPKFVQSFQELEEYARAFADDNPLWESTEVRLRTREWAAQVGQSVLESVVGYEPVRDRLGWCDSQALVAFAHNVPNNTLQLFWAPGRLHGKSFVPLLDRYE